MEIVREAGTDFAVPEKTVTVSKARQPEEGAAEAVESEVDEWRKGESYPLPNLAGEEIDRIRDTLEYPSKGEQKAE